MTDFSDLHFNRFPLNLKNADNSSPTEQLFQREIRPELHLDCLQKETSQSLFTEIPVVGTDAGSSACE